MDTPQPIVLVGGRSQRFGRDKLREPHGDGWLVDRAINALRTVFGPKVLLAGPCDPQVARRGDGVIHDLTPHAGPLGGIASALAQYRALFVLPGDLPNVNAHLVRTLAHDAAQHPDAWAVLAHTGAPEPCVGVYRAAALETLRGRLAQGLRGLHDALPAQHVRWMPCDPAVLRNANRPEDLASG